MSEENQNKDAQYATFSHSFTDPWLDREITLDFRFSKPGKSQIQRLQDRAGKNPALAARGLLLDTVHPDDKDTLTQAMEEYAGIATSLSTALIKGVGISAELGN